MFLCPKTKHCIVINELRSLTEKTIFKGCDREMSGVSFEEILDLKRGQTVKNISKLKWRRELQGIKVPHRKINCGNCLEDEKCQSCVSYSKMNCFDCELAKSCRGCYRKKTQIATYSTEINKLNREAQIENAYMLPHYVEDVV